MSEPMDYEVGRDLAVISPGSVRASRWLPGRTVASLRRGGDLAPNEATGTVAFEHFVVGPLPSKPQCGAER